MKKIFALVPARLLIASLAGCGRNDAEPETEPSQIITPSTTPITVPTLPDMTMPSSNIPDPTVNSNSGNNETEVPVK